MKVTFWKEKGISLVPEHLELELHAVYNQFYAESSLASSVKSIQWVAGGRISVIGLGEKEKKHL